MGLKIKSPSTSYLGSLTKPNISNASGLTVHSLSTVYLGSAVDPESGGGVQFKTSIYATGNAYIFLDGINANGIRIVGTLNDTTSIPSTYKTHSLIGYIRSSSEPSGWEQGYLLFFPGSLQKDVRVGYGGGVQSVTLVDSSGTVVSVDFDIEKKNMSTQAKWGVLCRYRNYDNSFDNFMNDQVKAKQIILYNGDVEAVNLVPAIVNGESGMYDTINKQFYGNANTVGSLICE